MEYCPNCTEPLHGSTVCPHCGFSGQIRDVPHLLRPGTVLDGRYLVGGCLGQGGFGITYAGRNLRLDMRIAIKEYYPNGYANRSNRVSNDITIINESNLSFIKQGIQRFLSEARVLARFDAEPGIVSVRDFFEANQTAYIIMEYLEGTNLAHVLKERLFSADEIFQLMDPMMQTLEHIHAANIIHRDISPDNLMLLSDGTLKLMDFGSARLVDYSDPRSLSVVLKAGYAPEEQYRSRGKQGPWTDIYSLCATIYKCITGITPDDALERGYQDLIQWPSELNIPITQVQEAVLKKGMAFRQENRFQSIAELRNALYRSPISTMQHIVIDHEDERTVLLPPDDEQLDKTVAVKQHIPEVSLPAKGTTLPLKSPLKERQPKPSKLENLLTPFDVSLNGVLYQLPVPLSQLDTAGWRFEKTAVYEQVFQPQESYSANMFLGSGKKNSIWVHITNLNKANCPINECHVTALSVGNWQVPDVMLLIAGCVHFGLSRSDFYPLMENKGSEDEHDENDEYYLSTSVYSYGPKNSAIFSFDDFEHLNFVTLYCEDRPSVDRYFDQLQQI